MAKRRWQFSTRWLLVVTAIVSFVLAVAVRLPVFFKGCLLVAAPTLLLIALFQSANFATSDRRPRLALMAWLALGAFFAFFTFAIVMSSIRSEDRMWGFTVVGFAVMSLCCAVCLAKAWKSLLLVLSPPDRVDSVAIDPSNALQDNRADASK
jgi:hypothetical protein